VTKRGYSLGGVIESLGQTLEQYLEAQYHIWDPHLIRERLRLLRTPGVLAQAPHVEATPVYKMDRSYGELRLPDIAAEVLSAAASDRVTGVPRRPYVHQAKALHEFVVEQKELVVATGTGSGKTESFLLPILTSLALEKAKNQSYSLPGVRALLLYPMNALVGDQLARLRRLFGSPVVTDRLRRDDGYRATFGMYTSRTPYPGQATAARNKERVTEWIRLFFDQYSEQKELLEREGKWPKKDLQAFRASLTTQKVDCELLTRHEMHRRPPDVLVTNYSMLEYMLVRPIEQPIFDKTQQWLDADETNRLTVVLDEAHFYQGSQGSEVALLLRRLISRLRIPRERVRFILTSASLGGDESEIEIRNFAAELTGGDPAQFSIVRGIQDRPSEGRAATPSEGAAFAAFDYAALHGVPLDTANVASALNTLASQLGHFAAFDGESMEVLQASVFQLLQQTPVAQRLVNRTMGTPCNLHELAAELFPGKDSLTSLNALLALGNFAKTVTDESERIFLACRLHLLYRGLEGLFACANPNCSAREDRAVPTLLGRLYATPRLRCECGSRVYELFTHRDCGAAYLRGYVRPGQHDFLWHMPSSGRVGSVKPLEAIDLLVETKRDHTGDYNDGYLHLVTGRLVTSRADHSSDKYLHVRLPGTKSVPVEGRPVITFPGTCPVCRKRWQDRKSPKIMDLVTKGEAPFAHLIAAQVRLQPASREATPTTPNAGRKSLLFSDGRQKAARLARDLPREIEQDAFRLSLIAGVREVARIRKEARLENRFIYPSLIAATAAQHLSFFDGDDADLFASHQRAFIKDYGGRLEEALEDWPYDACPSYYVNMLRTFGNRHYSVFSLALGYVRPSERHRNAIQTRLQSVGLEPADADAVAVVWIQGMLEDYALFSPTVVKSFVRSRAAGYPVTDLGTKSGFDRTQKTMLGRLLSGGPQAVASLESSLLEILAEPAPTGLHNLLPGKLALEIAIDKPWFGCHRCTFLAPVTLRGRCAHCGEQSVSEWRGGDEYLRARKRFWREPVRQLIAGEMSPLTLDVQEHTAQLGFRDVDDLEATTETFERRFRDILLPAKNERSIDVLSCTTTMEVGIDIGSLIAVGLRNIPPSRHNYQQRAGRAGRRGSAISTVVTYAQNNPHDAYYFERPAELIAGPAHLLGLDVDNPALVRRHVNAELLQEYFRAYPPGSNGGSIFRALGDTIAFFTSEHEPSLKHFSEWTSREGEHIINRIDQWIPDGIGQSAHEFAQECIRELRENKPASEDALLAGEEDLLEFLFGRGFLPAYAFPRDLVTLQVERMDGVRPATHERTQQSANVALSEYAPGRLVVVNKKTYRIGAVTASTPSSEVNRARRLFRSPAVYLQCPNCQYTEDPDDNRIGQSCPICRNDVLKKITAIEPEYVWPEGGRALAEDDDEQMTTETTVAQLPVPSSDDAFDPSQRFGPTSAWRHGRNVELIIVNRGGESAGGPSGFLICRDCGHAVTDASSFATPHQRDYLLPKHPPFPRTSECNGIAAQVYLGYRFRTDVLLLTTTLQAPFVFDLADVKSRSPLNDALLSLAHAVAIAASTILGVDTRELQCGYRLTRTAGEAKADIYLYDALRGGAGYARMAGEKFREVFKQAKDVLTRCPNPECVTSCTQCLRSYGNRFQHSRLDRRIALDLARYIEGGTAPKPYSRNEQEQVLEPLRNMLALEGWLVRRGDTCALIAASKGKEHHVHAIPSLLDVTAMEDSHLPGDVILRAFDIENDLPSCLNHFAV
jgi:ATP-dependent helicase YprA (DUF1998 family)